MSAFQCSDDHIKQMAAFLCCDSYDEVRSLVDYRGFGFRPKRPDMLIEADELATHYANLLMRENERSLRARYGDDDITPALHVTLGEVLRMDQVSPVAMLKSVSCYEYQARESTDWEQTDAFKLCQVIKAEAIRKLDGYEDANWGKAHDFPAPAAQVISVSSMMTG